MDPRKTLIVPGRKSTSKVIRDPNSFEGRAKAGLPCQWINMPSVVAKGGKDVLKGPIEYKLQENMVEIIKTEAVFLDKMETVLNNFVNSGFFSPTNDNLGYMNPLDKHRIFLNLPEIITVSKKFLDALQKRWNEQKPVLKNIFDIINQFANSHFQPYVSYMKRMHMQAESFSKILNLKQQAVEIQRLETKYLNGQTLQDTMLQPMQRMMRIKLLCDGCKSQLTKLVAEDRKMYMQASLDCPKAIVSVDNLIKSVEKTQPELDYKNLLEDLIPKMDVPPCAKSLQLNNRVMLYEVEINGIYSFSKTINLSKPKLYVILVMVDLIMVIKRVGSRVKLVDSCKRKDFQISSLIQRLYSSGLVPDNVRDMLKENVGIIFRMENSTCNMFRSPIISKTSQRYEKDQLFVHLADYSTPEKFPFEKK